MKFQPIYIVVFIVIFSCAKIEKEILIDNPSEKTIIVKFDDQDILQIDAGQTVSKIISGVSVDLRVNSGEVLKVNFEKDKEYLLNPLLATYYIEEIELFASEAARAEYLKYTPDIEEHFSVVEGIKIPGKYEKVDDLLIEKTWEYGLKDNPRMKSGIRTQTKKDRYLLQKIHRRNDLIRLLQNDFNEEVKNKFKALEI